MRPDGDKSGPHDKTPFHLQAEDTKSPTRNNDRDHRLTVDVSGSEDVVRLKTVGLRKSGARCEGDAVRVTCEVDGTYDSWADLDRVHPKPAKGAEPGDTGVVRFTYTTQDGEKLTARTRVVVGEPVIEVRTIKPFKDVRPGSGITAPVVVRNSGEVPVEGLGLKLVDGTMDFTQRYSNCRYPEPQRGHMAICRFPDLRIKPGEAVVLRPAVRLRAPKATMYGSFGQDAWALDMGPGKYGVTPDGGDAGDGPALEAERADDADAKGTFAKGGASTEVTLDTGSDYEVSDVDLKGEPGTEREVRLTVRNNGPGDPGPATELVFSPPFGVTVLKQPMTAIDEDVYEPYCEGNGFAYTCDVGALKPGEDRTFEFTLRLGEPGEGTATVMDKEDSDRRDPNPGNDEATIRVRP
ncbi:hypothetical protein FNH08_28170 [Streptomyces spongiae]|uniref:DUF11 domain-containing protein n=1 Tax=Streptomyces spongiae TaxID=565072 RepID=A0A5N8XN66_9ACTN|nr:hypothetical protein [Streptomyces spongiae]